MRQFPVLLAVIALASLCGCAGTSKSGATAEPSTTAQPAPEAPAGGAAAGKVHKLASGLVYEDIVVGNGTMADPGLTVTVNYSGRLTDGTEFDSSARSGRPLVFQLGAGRVIAGWEQGIKGMRIGGKRKLTIPPDLAYGSSGNGNVIPPNATLVFDIELLGVK